MERRNRAVKALKQLRYIDSIKNSEQYDLSIQNWINDYIDQKTEHFFVELTSSEKEQLSELYFTNIKFLKENRAILKKDLDSIKLQKKFLANS